MNAQIKKAKQTKTITKPVKVGIYENCEYIAHIYADKIIVTSPYVKWIGNTGGYAEHKEVIRNQETINSVLADLSDDCEDSAWDKIGNELGESYLQNWE